MKLLLIVPRYNYTNKVNYQYVFPLGLAYISAVIKKSGYDLDCINLNHLEGSIDSLIKLKLDEKKYDIILTGHIGIGYEVIEKIINSVRSHSTNPKIIVGGSLVTAEKEIMLKSLKPDFTVIGEGELTVINLLDAIKNNKDFKNVNGIGFLNRGEVFFTKPEKIIHNLDSLPFPDFESLGYREYLDNQTSDSNYYIVDYPRSYPILCSRGCPNQCTFCYHSIGFGFRMRSLDNIFEELKLVIKKYNINSLEINDDLFSLNKTRLFEFCKRIKELSKEYNIHLIWSCQLTVNNLDEELLRILKDAGCCVVSFGFESYSKKILESMKKPITPEKIDNAIKLSMKVGIGLQGNFIFGDIAETNETAKETLDYWKNNCKGQIKLGFIQPYPGSEIFERCIEKGIIKDKVDFIKNQMNHTNWFNMTDSMTDGDILNLKKQILDSRRKFYPYIIPKKVRKIKNNRYSFESKCPFCKEKTNYKNCAIDSKLHFTFWVTCRKCFMRYCVVSRFYKFQSDHYNGLDFIRRKYLYFKDKLKKRTM